MVHATNTEYDPDLDNVRFIMYLPGGMPNPEGAQMIAYAGVTTELTVYSPLDFEQNFCDDLSCDADITCCYGPTPVGTISSGIQTGTFKVVGDGNFFGPAREPMQRYYELCEKRWLEQEGEAVWFRCCGGIFISILVPKS